ncbi:UPF0481 protein [Cocos nucifera]|uniref:UPF0481 protein n=1 Tax=Cocos nucifera TaxID=13894 RepID=A0A8K0HWP7_COCNU|nr:UPF0481 protein [Cocos nucifera]
MDESLGPKGIVKAGLSIYEPEEPSYTGERGIPSAASKSDEVWINEMMDHVKSARPVDHPDSPCTIFKVPEHIRQLDPKAYDPIVVPLGPFRCAHWSHSSVTLDHKRRYVWHLLSRRDGSEERANQLLKECLMELKKRDKMVRHCYHPELPRELDAHNLASIMLLDGCFIIYLMLKMHAGKKGMDEETEEDESKKTREWKIEMGEDGRVLNVRKGHEQLESPHEVQHSTFNIVVYDVLKLENQIPFFIIQLLFDHLKPCGDKEIDLVDLALQLFKGIHPKESKSFKKQEKEDPSKCHHLLHLFYLSRIHSKKPVEPTSAATWIRCAIEFIKSKWKLSKKKPKWKKAGATSSPRNWPSTPRWTPNATELDRVGVKFKRKERADSFLNMTFKQKSLPRLSWLCLMFKSGCMEIPPLQIYDYTGHLFRNLMAFEQ